MEGGKLLLEVIMKPRTELVFRTPTPFAMGGYAETLPRPPEFSIAGMIRSAIRDLAYTEGTNASPKILGTNKKYTTYDFCWKLVGPYFLHNGRVYYPTPMDVFVDESDTKRNEEGVFKLPDWLIPQLEPYPNGSAGSFREVLAPSVFSGDQAWRRYWLVSSEFMRKYLEGEKVINGKDEAVGESEVLLRKKFVSVQLERKSKTVKIKMGEGQQFTVEKVYLKDGWSFIAGVWLKECEEKAETFRQLDGKTVRLGGEGSFVELEVREAQVLLEKDVKEQSFEKARLVLTSSAIFKMNDKSTFLPSLGEVKGCACARIVIGGWDYVTNNPKATLFGVVPGSIYYIENVSSNIVLDRNYVHPSYRNILGSSLIAEGWGI